MRRRSTADYMTHGPAEIVKKGHRPLEDPMAALREFDGARMPYFHAHHERRVGRHEAFCHAIRFAGLHSRPVSWPRNSSPMRGRHARDDHALTHHDSGNLANRSATPCLFLAQPPRSSTREPTNGELTLRQSPGPILPSPRIGLRSAGDAVPDPSPAALVIPCHHGAVRCVPRSSCHSRLLPLAQDSAGRASTAWSFEVDAGVPV